MENRNGNTVTDRDSLLDKIMAAAAGGAQASQPLTVLIDGPSGAGKTSAAAELSARTGWHVVHLDEFYPGWHGLFAASQMVADLVLREKDPGYWRWDWANDRRGKWVSLEGVGDLIIEGVGALTTKNLAAAERRGAALSVYIDGPRTQRRARALTRDPGYAPWFETWERQEKVYFHKLCAPAQFSWTWP